MKVAVLWSHIFVLFLAGCGHPQQNVIPLQMIGTRSHVTVKIGDLVIPDILLDTGFAFDGLMIYNPDYRDSLKSPNAIEIKIGGAGSGAPARAMMVDSATFHVGPAQMINQRLIIMQSDLYKGFSSKGIIGYSIFGHYITEIDNDNHTMILHDSTNFHSDKTWTTVPIFFKNNKLPWLDISVVIDRETPVPLKAYIDYAAGDAVVLLEKPDMKFALPQETESLHLGRGLSGDIYGRSGVISKLIIGPFELRQVKASFADAQVRSKQENADAVIGSAALAHFNFIFDYTHHKLYLKPNSHFDEAFE